MKFWILAAVLAFTLGLAGCGSSNSNKGNDTGAGSATTAPNNTTGGQTQGNGANGTGGNPNDTNDVAGSNGTMEGSQNGGMGMEGSTGAGSLSELLDPIWGYGQSTAGGSLKNLTYAAGLLDWWENRQLEDPLADPSGELQEWYGGLTPDQQETFRENWAMIRQHADALVQDPGSLGQMTGDAGITRDYTGMAGNYGTFFDAVDRLF